MQVPSKLPVKLANSLAVKKSSSPLAILPCMEESSIKLASSWQERAASCRVTCKATCRNAGLTQQGSTNRHWCRRDARRTRQFDWRVEVQIFFYKTQHMWLPCVCIPFFCLYLPHCIRFFSYSCFHCILSSLGTTCSCKYCVN